MALNPKQQKALELLTCGKGLTYKEIAEEVGVTPKTIWNWRCGKDFTEFQEELKRLNEERWIRNTTSAALATSKSCVTTTTQQVSSCASLESS